MKKLLLTSLLALGLLASCGGEPADQPAGESAATSTSKSAASSKHTHKYVDDPTKAVAATCTAKGKKVGVCECGQTKETEVAMLDHTYVEDPTKAVQATCAADGKKVEKCSVCGKEVETVLPKGAHTWGAETVLVAKDADAASTGTKTRQCTTCNKHDFVIDAMDWTNITGSNKDTTGATLKFSTNNNYAEYDVTIPAEMTNVTVALYGMVDYFHDDNSSNANHEKSFFPSGDTANFSVKLGDTAVEVTNHDTYETMFNGQKGEKLNLDGKGDCQYSVMALCTVGTVASIAAGALKVTYTRLASYNLNITEIHLLY